MPKSWKKFAATPALYRYTGPLPYWNETADINQMDTSPVFQPEAFGGNGAHPEYNGDINKDLYNNVSCITNGAFVNTTLHITASLDHMSNYCISRVFNNSILSLWANQSAVDMCQSKPNYEEHWNCMAAMQHRAGHLGIGGVMGAVAINPGDVMFFLHREFIHAFEIRYLLLVVH
jgi:tyrosinase